MQLHNEKNCVQSFLLFHCVKEHPLLLPTFQINKSVQMRQGEKVAASHFGKVSKRRTTFSTGSLRHQETDWENVSLSLTAEKGRREGGHSDPSPPVFSSFLLHSCRLYHPVQSDCLPLFHFPALRDTFPISISSISSPPLLFAFISVFFLCYIY